MHWFYSSFFDFVAKVCQPNCFVNIIININFLINIVYLMIGGPVDFTDVPSGTSLTSICSLSPSLYGITGSPAD